MKKILLTIFLIASLTGCSIQPTSDFIGADLGSLTGISENDVKNKYDSSTEIKAKYSRDKTAFVIGKKITDTKLDENGQEVEFEYLDPNAIKVEIGDKAKTTFEPEINISRWNEEVKFKLKPKTLGSKKELVFDKDVIKYKDTDDLEYHYYDIAESTEHPEGAYEFEIIFNTKPKSNKIILDIETQGLKFNYQRALTQYEKDNGMSSPDNVIGSYAVYHESKKNNQYKAGKAFHIYRPKIIDADKKWVWGELNIDTDKNELTITIPQSFLDTGAYPIIVDPTFGYTSVGGVWSSWGAPDELQGYRTTSLNMSSTIASISLYMKYETNNSYGIKGVLTLSSNDNIVSNGVGTGTNITSLTGAWFASNFSTPPSISSSTNYTLCGISEGGANHFYAFDWDSGEGDDFYDDTNSYTTPTNPTDGTYNYNSMYLSIYATYTDTDVAVDTNVKADLSRMNAPFGPYYINTTDGVIVYVDSVSDIVYKKTEDGGATWGTKTLIADVVGAGAVLQMVVWFDQETPGDTGTLLHIAWLDGDNNDALYKTLDISDETLGTQRTVDSTITVAPQVFWNRMAITKTLSDNIIVAFSTQTEVETYRSTDNGATWDDRADVFETTTEEDFVLLYPANTGDDDDAVAVFWDRSADEISLKMYDESANSWTETSISGSMSDGGVFVAMDASVRHSDNHLLLAAHSDDASAGDDLKTWDLTVDNIATPTVTARTNIFTDQNASAQASVFINQQNDDVYVAYLKGGTWGATVDVVYHKSTNDMTSWGSEQGYSTAVADDFRVVNAGRTVGSSGGRYQPTWENDDLDDIFVNTDNDVEIVASASEARKRLIIIQ